VVYNCLSHLRVLSAEKGGATMSLGPCMNSYFGATEGKREVAGRGYLDLPVHIHVIREVLKILIKELKRSGFNKKDLQSQKYSEVYIAKYAQVERTFRMILETSIYLLSQHIKAYIQNGYGLPSGQGPELDKFEAEYLKGIDDITRRLKDHIRTQEGEPQIMDRRRKVEIEMRRNKIETLSPGMKCHLRFTDKMIERLQNCRKDVENNRYSRRGQGTPATRGMYSRARRSQSRTMRRTGPVAMSLGTPF